MTLIERLRQASSAGLDSEDTAVMYEAAFEIERLETALRDRDAALESAACEAYCEAADEFAGSELHPDTPDILLAWLDSKTRASLSAAATIDREQEANK